MIPKYEGTHVTRKIVERYLGFHEAQKFFEEYLFPVDIVNEWLKCTPERPNTNGHSHDLVFSHVINEDHGDEVWYCKNCKKRVVHEGPDA